MYPAVNAAENIDENAMDCVGPYGPVTATSAYEKSRFTTSAFTFPWSAERLSPSP